MEQKRTLELYVVLSYDTKQLSKLFEFRSKSDCSVWVIVEYEMVNLKTRKIDLFCKNPISCQIAHPTAA